MELSENKKALICVALLVIFGLIGVYGSYQNIPFMSEEEFTEEEEIAELEEAEADFENTTLEEEMPEFENILLEETQTPE